MKKRIHAITLLWHGKIRNRKTAQLELQGNIGYSYKNGGHMNLKERGEKLKIDIPAVFLALSRKETPLIAKLLAGITIGYALSPIDLIPDFIPVLGYLDDVILLPFLIALTIKMIPVVVFAECREQSQNLWANGKPKKWYFAIPIIFIWMLCAYFIIKAVVLR